MTKIVVDIETPDNASTSAILSIGAAALNKDGAVAATFYTPVNLQSCLDLGLTMGASTIAWWMEQAEEARKVWAESASKDAPTLPQALVLFHDWLRTQGETKYIELYGNGSDFDNVIMANAYKVCGRQQPWPFWGNRCFRTLKNTWKRYVPEPEFIGVKHNAMDDAVHEAIWLARILAAEKASMQAAEAAGLITKQEYPRG